MIRKLPYAYYILGLLALSYMFMSNSSNPPNGKTGAPNEQTCAQCHSGGNFNGDIAVSGIPSSVVPGTTYNVTVTNSFIAGTTPIRSGFQIVALDDSNTEAGTISNVGNSATTVVFGGKTYVEHAPALNFNGNSSVSWTYDWTAPVGNNGDVLSFYFSSVFGNGSGSTNDTVESGSFDVTIDNNSGGSNLSASIFFENDVNCNGASNGSAAVLASNGTAPYTYLWDNGQTAATATALAAGNYTVVVTDNLGATASATATIGEPLALGVNIVSQQDVTCSANGEIIVQAIGGNAPYSYAWPSGGNSNFESGFTSGGLYNLTITDNSNCVESFSIQINEDTEIPSINIPSTGFIDCTNPCFTVSPNVSSSSSNLVYQWMDNNGNTISTNLVEDLCSGGNYTFQVTNLDNGCTGAAQILINDNSGGFSVNITGGSLLTCTNVTSSLSASTSQTGETYLWAGPNGFNSTNNQIQVTDPGTYTVVATFTNGCSSQASYNQQIDIAPPNLIILPPSILSCTNSTVLLDGSNSSSQSGAAISFEWYDANGSIIGTNSTIIVSASGTYTLRVEDLINNCESFGSVDVVEDLNAPNAVAMSNGILNCNFSTISLSGLGSQQGGNVTYIWTTLDGNLVSGATTLSPTVDQTGTYTLTVLDASNGCTNSASTVVEQDINDPDASIFSNSSTLDCNITSLNLDASGSSTGIDFNYDWTSSDGNIVGSPSGFSVTIDQSGSYELLVTNTLSGCTNTASIIINQDIFPPLINPIADITIDCVNNNSSLDVSSSNMNGNSCFWSGPNNFSSSDFIISPSAPGTYCAVITGTNGCTSQECANVSVDTNFPIAVANASGILSCANASILLNGNGSSTGTDFSYFWSTADGNIIADPMTLNPEINLAGTYVLTVANNSNGCTSTASVTVQAPIGIITTPISNNISCNGFNDGNINVNVTQGLPPYQYIWSNGANTAAINNLAAGSYAVTVTDANTCQITESFFISEPSILNLSLNANGETSAGANNGNAMANVSGGTPPYNYAWSNGGTTAFISSLSPGDYTVTVTDASNCQMMDVVSVSEFGCTLSLTVDAINISCFGLNDGSLTAIPSAGSAPYTFLWSNGATTQNLSNLSAGTYTVTATDANNCSMIATGMISQAAQLNAFASNIINIDCANPKGSVELIVNGGNEPYTFLWSDPSLPNQICNPGTYTVTVSDDNACSTIETFDITEDINLPTAIIEDPGIIDCTNPVLQLDATNSSVGTSIVYDWTTTNGNIIAGSNTLSPTINLGGTYTLTVTDNLNVCTAQASITIVDNSDYPNIINDGLETSLTCINNIIALTEGNPNPDYLYQWKDGSGTVIQSGPSINLTDCGIFFLCIEDMTNGCIATSDSIKISCDTLGVVADAGENQIIDCNTPFVTLGGTSTSTGPNYLYEWFDASGNLQGTLSTFITDICGTYTLIVTDINTGCSDEDEVSLTCTSGLPTADAGIDVILVPSCTTPNPNFPVSLDGSNSNTGIMFTYIWTTDDGNIVSGESSLNPVVDAFGTYTLEVKNLNTNCSAFDEVIVKIDEDIILPEAIVLPYGKFNCQNTMITLDASNSIGSGTLSFNWLDPNLNSIGNLESIMVNSPGIYTLIIAADVTNCEAQLLLNVEEEEFDYIAEVELLPCRQDSFYITLDITGDHPPFDITWENGLQGDSILASSSGTLSFTITDDIGCTIEGETLNVDFAEPILDITEVEIVNTTGSDGSIDIDVFGIAPPFTFIWSNGETSEDIFDLASGDYSVTITDANGCEYSADYFVDLIFSSVNVDETDLISMFPNPSTGLVYIETKISIESIEIFSINGKFLGQLRLKELNAKRYLDLEHQHTGLYYLRVTEENGKSFFKKLLKI